MSTSTKKTSKNSPPKNNENANLKTRKIYHIVHWIFHNLCFAFLFPLALTAIESLVGTKSFWGEMCINYLLVIVAQAVSLIWTCYSLPDDVFESKESRSFLQGGVYVALLIVFVCCIIFFSAFSNSIAESARFAGRKWVLIGSSIAYTFFVIKSMCLELKAYTPTN